MRPSTTRAAGAAKASRSPTRSWASQPLQPLWTSAPAVPTDRSICPSRYSATFRTTILPRGAYYVPLARCSQSRGPCAGTDGFSKQRLSYLLVLVGRQSIRLLAWIPVRLAPAGRRTFNAGHWRPWIHPLVSFPCSITVPRLSPPRLYLDQMHSMTASHLRVCLAVIASSRIIPNQSIIKSCHPSPFTLDERLALGNLVALRCVVSDGTTRWGTDSTASRQHGPDSRGRLVHAHRAMYCPLPEETTCRM